MHSVIDVTSNAALLVSLSPLTWGEDGPFSFAMCLVRSRLETRHVLSELKGIASHSEHMFACMLVHSHELSTVT